MTDNKLTDGRVPLAVVSCDGCGACCETQGTPPFSWCEGDRPPPHLLWDIDEHMAVAGSVLDP